jgi:methyl-accepting chemotaxis protein
MTIDFSQARFKHINWKFRIRNFLDGKETLTEAQAVSHKDCDLGKWYYTVGKAKYGHLEAMQKFEIEHEELHQLVKEIRLLRIANNLVEAENKFIILTKTSDTIVDLLTRAENEINSKSK